MKIFAEPSRIGSDAARLEWIMATWRKRGVVFDEPRTQAVAELDRHGRDAIDRAMAKARGGG